MGQAGELSGIVVYGTTWCPDCSRSCRLLEARRLPYRWVDIEEDAEGLAFVERINRGLHSVPTIVFPDGEVLVEPLDEELAKKLA
jgi:mycoredoxin